MNWLERARREIQGIAGRPTANAAEGSPMAATAVPNPDPPSGPGASIGSNDSVLSPWMQETDAAPGRRIVRCRDCAHFIPSAPVHRASGAVWEMPGGCSQARTSPDARPPIYACTGWYCAGWTSGTKH